MKFLFTVCTIVILIHAFTGHAQATTINVPGDYASIQAAIDAASTGDTIYVSPGEYHENVKVNKQLSIYSMDGPSATTVVANDPKDDVFEITANNVTIYGFTVTGTESGNSIPNIGIGYAGIFLNNVSSCSIYNNVANSNGAGIYLYQSHSNTVENNNASSNHDRGINLYLSNNNKLAGNTVNSNGPYGIFVQWLSYYNTLENNIANSNSSGIIIGNSAYTTMTNNKMADNTANFGVTGFAFPDPWASQWTHWIDTSNTVDGKPIYYLMDTQSETIDSSTNAGCVYCLWCNDMTVKDLTLCDNRWGVFLLETDNSVIQNNAISDSGIALWHSDNNLVHHNNFTNPWASDLKSEGNYWYDPTLLEGNYWSDYSGVDDGSGTGKHAIAGDGIGDTGIPCHYDYYPLVNPWVNKITVAIDIKPGSDPNPINQGSNGLVPVAILSNVDFDATQIDPTSVVLAGAGVAVRGKGKAMAHQEDVNGDGLTDLVVQVETQSFADLGDGGTVELTGATFAGQAIVGYDDVIVVPPELQQ